MVEYAFMLVLIIAVCFAVIQSIGAKASTAFGPVDSGL